MRRVLFRLEATLVWLAIRLARALGPVGASNFGGAVARFIGPRLPVSRIADINLRLALPGLDAVARRRIIRGMWDNLGRTVAELPHLPDLRRTDTGPGWQVRNEHFAAELAAKGGPAVVFSGHIGNWEVLVPASAALGVPFSMFYRPAANPIVDAMITDLRSRAMGTALKQFPKGATGARAALAWLARGGIVGVLVDQKLNDGIAVPLFGHAAMTAPAAAVFALRLRCPLLPGHVRRLGPARFELVVERPLDLPDSGDRQADIAALTRAINATLERWIEAEPHLWLWLHRRWPQEHYRQ